MLDKPSPTPRPVSIALGGRHYSGNYVVERGLITVSALGLIEAMPVGRVSAEDQARRMVAEIVRKRTPTQVWGVA